MLTWGLFMAGLVLLVIGVAMGIWIIIGIGVIVIIADVLLVVRRASRIRRSGAEATSQLEQVEPEVLTTPNEPGQPAEDLDYIEKLKILAQTRDEGIITEEEFEKKKNEILRDST